MRRRGGEREGLRRHGLKARHTRCQPRRRCLQLLLLVVVVLLLLHRQRTPCRVLCLFTRRQLSLLGGLLRLHHRQDGGREVGLVAGVRQQRHCPCPRLAVALPHPPQRRQRHLRRGLVQGAPGRQADEPQQHVAHRHRTVRHGAGDEAQQLRIGHVGAPLPRREQLDEPLQRHVAGAVQVTLHVVGDLGLEQGADGAHSGLHGHEAHVQGQHHRRELRHLPRVLGGRLVLQGRNHRLVQRRDHLHAIRDAPPTLRQRQCHLHAPTLRRQRVLGVGAALGALLLAVAGEGSLPDGLFPPPAHHDVLRHQHPLPELRVPHHGAPLAYARGPRAAADAGGGVGTGCIVGAGGVPQRRQVQRRGAR